MAAGRPLKALNTVQEALQASYERIEPENPGLVTVVIIALGMFWDIGEVNLSSVFSALFSLKTSQVPPDQLAWLLAAPYIGAVAGAPIFGWLADKKGRRGTMILALWGLAATTCCAAFSPSATWLTAFRLLSGLTMGGYLPIAIAYLADVLPAKTRGKTILMVSGFSVLGAPAIIFAARGLATLPAIGEEAWRWVCGGSSVGIMTAALATTWLSESHRWSLTQRQSPTDEQTVAPAAGNWRTAFLILLTYFFGPWSTVGFSLLSGAMLVQKGFGLQDTLFVLGLSLAGALVGCFFMATWIDRIPRRGALWFTSAGMVVTEFLFALSSSQIALEFASLAFTIFATIYIPLLNIYTAEIFPTHFRARATSTGWAANRLASVIVPLVLLPILHLNGVLAVCAVMALSLSVSAVFLTMTPPDRALKPIG